MAEHGCVAITGATGLIGRHLCARFAAEGWEVRALARRPEAVHPGRGIAAYLCELPDRLDPAGLRGCSATVHCAYTTRQATPVEAQRVNLEGSRRLLDESRRLGAGRFIFLSSLAADPDAPSLYGRSKFEVEQLLDHDRDLAIRAGLVVSGDSDGGGLFHRIAGWVASGRRVPLLDHGRQILQTVHVADLCQAIINGLRSGVSGVRVVADPVGTPMREFLSLLACAQGVPLKCVSLPAGPILAAVRVAEALRIPLPVSSENLLGWKSMRFVDSAADLQLLGVTVADTPTNLARAFAEMASPSSSQEQQGCQRRRSLCCAVKGRCNRGIRRRGAETSPKEE